MASTAHKNKDEIQEHIESEQQLEQKAKQLASLIQKSKHCIFFTGAGISTSIGIPDFRGPEGVWTLAKYGGQRKAPSVSTLKAIPSATHMALVELTRRGLVKHVVSQNVDGLHRRSGLLPATLSELHGNTNLEFCIKCKKEYLRDTRVRSASGVFEHQTGRFCDDAKCGGMLHDTIINFGENLPQKVLQDSFEHAKKADLCVSLGSSLTVSPANQIPEIVGENHKLVIANLQHTPLDQLSHLRIYGKTDDVMTRVMKHLNIPIPTFILQRRVRIGPDDSGKCILVRGVDLDGTPFSLFPKVVIDGKQFSAEEKNHCKREYSKLKHRCEIVLHFTGHYNEPPVTIQHNAQEDCTYLMQFDPLAQSKQWSVQVEKSHAKKEEQLL